MLKIQKKTRHELGLSKDYTEFVIIVTILSQIHTREEVMVTLTNRVNTEQSASGRCEADICHMSDIVTY